MDKEQILSEIERLEKAIKKSSSPYLKRDFGLRVSKLRKELWRMSND